MIAINIENLKKRKYDIFLFLKNKSFYCLLSIAAFHCGHEYEKEIKEEESIETLRILGVINNIEQ